MDLECCIAVLSFKEGRTDMIVVRHCAPLTIWQKCYCWLKENSGRFVSGAPIFESMGSLGPRSIILDPLLDHTIGIGWQLDKLDFKLSRIQATKRMQFRTLSI